MIRRLWDMFWDLLYPRKCIFCGRILKMKEIGFCKHCSTIPEPVLKPMITGFDFECCYSVYYYRNQIASAIKEYKFSGKIHYAKSFGILLAQVLKENRVHADVITWAPVSKKRKRKRGYDQGEELAKIVGRELGIPVKGLLKKVRHNAAQAMITDRYEREKNVKNAYSVVDASTVSGKRILLLDDVITTGATLTECSKTLTAAGARNIVCATFAAARDGET